MAACDSRGEGAEAMPEAMPEAMAEAMAEGMAEAMGRCGGRMAEAMADGGQAEASGFRLEATSGFACIVDGSWHMGRDLRSGCVACSLEQHAKP